MATFRSIKAWRKNNKKRINRLDKLKSPRIAAKKILTIQRSLVPKKTRETISKLKSRKINKNKYMIESDVTPKGETGFKQNQWANRGPNHILPKMGWNRGLPTMYGDGSHNITGTPRWFSIGAERGRKLFPKLVIREVRQIMKS